MSGAQFKGFLKPNFSFKEGSGSRGNKGVGATYLAYGFNYLEIATKMDSKTVHAGVIEHGREWVEDSSNIISRPTVQPVTPFHKVFDSIDRGTSFTLRLTGNHIRPKSLGYFLAKTAEVWLCLLRAHTPLGGIYLCGDKAPTINIELEVLGGKPATRTVEKLSSPRYLYPHEVLGKTADLRDFLKDQSQRAEKGLDVSKVPPKFSNLNGVWGEWTHEQILSNRSAIKPRLEDTEKELVASLGVQVYVFMCYSTDLWDDYNTEKLQLRKSSRILSGGLQQATKHMPQGQPITTH